MFKTNGTERLRITSAGLVGIGTSAPNYQLHVTTDFAVGASGFNQQLTFGNDTIQSLLLGTGYTALKLNPLGGNVGIGTTSPGELLQVKGNIALDDAVLNTPKYLKFNANSTSAEYGGIQWFNYQWDTAVRASITSGNSGALAAGYLAFSTGSGGATERARIDSSGRLLVGTSTARSTFYSTASAFIQIEGGAASGSESLAIVRNVNDIFGGSLILAKTRGTSDTIVTSGDTIGNVTWQGNDGSKFVQAARIEAQVDGTPGADDMPGRLVFFTTADGQSTPTERMRITSAGLVGIGTSSPSEKLDVFAGSLSVGSHYVATVNTDYKIRLRSVGAATNNNFTAEIGITGGGAQPAESSLTFATQTWNGSAYVVTEKMRVDPSGRVGIGTTSPSDKLETRGGAVVVGFSDNTTRTNKLFAGFGYETGGTLYGNVSIRSNYDNTNNSSTLNFHTASGAGADTERARIDSSGRLLVGTSSARSNFRVGVTNYQGTVQHESGSQPFFTVVGGTNGTSGPYLMLGHQRSGAVGGNTVLSSGDELGTISFHGSDGTNLILGASVYAVVDGTPGTNDLPTRLVFSTTADGASSPTERMRIDALGALKTSPNGTYKFPAGTTEITHNDATSSVQLIASSTGFTGDAVTISTYRNTVNDSYKFLSCIRQGFAIALEIRDDGDVYNVNGTYGSLSDVKLKENIVDANSQWDDIRQLRVRNYNFKPETNNSTHKQIGVIAQEIEYVSPGLVNTVPDRDEDGNDLGTVTKSVNYSVLYMKAVKALQEAMERIETLEARLTAAGIE